MMSNINKLEEQMVALSYKYKSDDVGGGFALLQNTTLFLFLSRVDAKFISALSRLL